MVEEMRRMLAYLTARAAWWQQAPLRRDVVTAAVASGLAAYAKEQAQVVETLRQSFIAMWTPALSKLEVKADFLTLYTPDIVMEEPAPVFVPAASTSAHPTVYLLPATPAHLRAAPWGLSVSEPPSRPASTPPASLPVSRPDLRASFGLSAVSTPPVSLPVSRPDSRASFASDAVGLLDSPVTAASAMLASAASRLAAVASDLCDALEMLFDGEGADSGSDASSAASEEEDEDASAGFDVSEM
jgi:hypothetical protein